jgi:cell division protein DivIC
MTPKKVTSATKRRLFIFGGLSVFIITYFVYISISYTYQYIKLINEKRVLEDNLYALKEKEQSLKIELVKLNDPEYIARYARENYLYSKDGEYIIKIEKKEEIKEEEITSKNYSIYFVYGSSLILLYFILKKILKRK